MMTEWRLYAVEDLQNVQDETRCDVVAYWKHVFEKKLPSGRPKYGNLEALVTCCLSLAHGNSDTERSFSETSKIITKHRNSMDATTLSSLLGVKSYLRSEEKKSHDFNISSEMLKYGRNARSRYISRGKEAERDEVSAKKKEREATQKKLMDAMRKQLSEVKEKSEVHAQENLVKKQKELSNSLRMEAQELINDANKKFKEADVLEKKQAKLSQKIQKKRRKRWFRQS